MTAEACPALSPTPPARLPWSRLRARPALSKELRFPVQGLHSESPIGSGHLLSAEHSAWPWPLEPITDRGDNRVALTICGGSPGEGHGPVLGAGSLSAVFRWTPFPALRASPYSSSSRRRCSPKPQHRSQAGLCYPPHARLAQHQHLPGPQKRMKVTGQWDHLLPAGPCLHR